MFGLKRKLNRPKMVAILGSGPAGLFAAQAVYDTGNVVQLYARGEKSPLYGAQYLHEAIPGLSLSGPSVIDYQLRGTADEYRRKVYGPDAQIQVSPESLLGKAEAWNIRDAYDLAWDRFSGLIHKAEITPAWLDNHGRMLMADLVVWSIPLPQQCVAGHRFAVQPIWAQGDAPELGHYCSVNVDPWTVVTNGEDSPRWYRASNVFGHRTAEWPDGPKPPVEGLVKVNKPIGSTCDCWMTLGGAEVLRVGRYGTWTKGELSHQAYWRTRSFLETM